MSLDTPNHLGVRCTSPLDELHGPDIRALDGVLSDLPIVALTANVLAHQRQAYLDAGMDGVIGKPISPTDLIREIIAASERRDTALDDLTAAA